MLIAHAQNIPTATKLSYTSTNEWMSENFFYLFFDVHTILFFSHMHSEGDLELQVE